jgi:DNA polymerase-3 subunit delta
VVLFWGEDEFLLRLAAHEELARRGVHATEVDGRDWQGGETSDLATPSLWGEARALLVTQAQGLPEAGANEVTAYAASPSPDAVCVLTVVTRGKGPPALAKAVSAGGGSARSVALRRQELSKWLLDRARSHGVRLGGPATVELSAILGEDPATLDQALEQLASAFPGKAVGPEEVRSQFEGLGEKQVWDLCDQAFAGRLAQAMVVLRALLEQRVDPLIIVGGVAARVRDLIRVRSVPDRTPPAVAAKAAGLRFEWQLKRYREQAARFSPAELSTLLEQVVDTDRAIKGGMPGDLVLVALVAAMAGHPEAALDVPARVGR